MPRCIIHLHNMVGKFTGTTTPPQPTSHLNLLMAYLHFKMRYAMRKSLCFRKTRQHCKTRRISNNPPKDTDSSCSSPNEERPRTAKKPRGSSKVRPHTSSKPPYYEPSLTVPPFTRLRCSPLTCLFSQFRSSIGGHAKDDTYHKHRTNPLTKD